MTALPADPSQLVPAREQMAFTLGFHIILVPFGVAFEGGVLVRRLRAITTTAKQVCVQHASQLYAGALVEHQTAAPGFPFIIGNVGREVRTLRRTLIDLAVLYEQ